MTRPEAIKILKEQINQTFSNRTALAYIMAVKALEQPEWHKGTPTEDGDYMCAIAREGGYKCALFTVVDEEIAGVPAELQEYFKRSIRAYIEVPAPPVAEKRTRRKKEKTDELSQ